MASISSSVEKLNKSFGECPRTVENTLSQLKQFHSNFTKSVDSLASALKDDFNRPVQETFTCEYGPVLSELEYFINNIYSLLKPSSPDVIPAAFSTLDIKIEPIALGTVLIIVPFNYPLLLSLSPLLGAFTSGNNVVIKLPYDQCPEFSSCLKQVLDDSFSRQNLLVVNGGIKESQELLDCKFDKILFTGSSRVGKIIQSKANENLTPTILELGGKSPVFITKNCSNLPIVVKRLLWGKFTNAGQTCVAPDYVLIDEKIYDEVIDLFKKVTGELFQNLDENSDFCHLVNENAFNRLTECLKSTKGEIITGGNSNKAKLFIEPTIITNINWQDSLMKEEIFGPLLPVIKYFSLKDEILNVINYHDTPLASYIFSDCLDDISQIKKIRSGSICINETLMNGGCLSTPFGGIGSSGFGNYHGAYSIKSFTHERTIMKQPIWSEFLLNMRYPPYTKKNLKVLSLMNKLPLLPIKTAKNIFMYLLVFVIGLYLGKWLA